MAHFPVALVGLAGLTAVCDLREPYMGPAWTWRSLQPKMACGSRLNRAPPPNNNMACKRAQELSPTTRFLQDLCSFFRAGSGKSRTRRARHAEPANTEALAGIKRRAIPEFDVHEGELSATATFIFPYRVRFPIVITKHIGQVPMPRVRWGCRPDALILAKVATSARQANRKS